MEKQTPLHMCYHVKFGSTATKGVRINRNEPPKLGSAGIPPLGWRRGWPLKTRFLPICVTTSNLLILWQRVYA